MKKRLLVMLALTTMMLGTTAFAAETELPEAQETEAEASERNYDPEEGTGWLVAKINDKEVEFEYESKTSGMTGTTYSFEAEDFTLSFVLNKALEVGTEMDENAITQIEVVSSDAASVGYYFSKKSTGSNVDSKVTLGEKSEDGLLKGEFSVKVLTADRYVGDNKPGILPELDFTDGEFCFRE